MPNPISRGEKREYRLQFRVTRKELDACDEGYDESFYRKKTDYYRDKCVMYNDIKSRLSKMSDAHTEVSNELRIVKNNSKKWFIVGIIFGGALILGVQFILRSFS